MTQQVVLARASHSGARAPRRWGSRRSSRPPGSRASRDGWAVSGPRFVPLVASVMLIVLAVAFLVRTVVRPDIELARFAAAEAARTHWPTPGLVMAGAASATSRC